MDSSPDNSFIPKRGPSSKPKHVTSRQVYLFTIVSYLLFFGALVASGGVFFYERYVTEQLQQEVVALDEEIGLFRESDMEAVRNFENRLDYTAERVAASVSLVSLFEVLEAATAESAQITDMTVERNGDNYYAVTANMQTDTYDSSFFQREFYEQLPLTNVTMLENVLINTTPEESTTANGPTVTFTAVLGVPVADIPSDPIGRIVPVNNSPVSEEEATTEAIEDASLEALNEPSV